MVPCDHILHRWRNTAHKAAILAELAEAGPLLEPLAEEIGLDLDPFDLICHIAFDQPPLTRREQAGRIKQHAVFTQYGEQARAALEALLDTYQ